MTFAPITQSRVAELTAAAVVADPALAIEYQDEESLWVSFEGTWYWIRALGSDLAVTGYSSEHVEDDEFDDALVRVNLWNTEHRSPKGLISLADDGKHLVAEAVFDATEGALDAQLSGALLRGLRGAAAFYAWFAEQGSAARPSTVETAAE
jgi:hypothetical protein